MAWLPLAAVLLLAGVAALWDWRTGVIPNWLTLPPIVCAPFAYLAFGGWPALAGSLLGLIGCGLVPVALFRLNAIGGGDVKLLAALGAVGGLSLGIEAQLFGMMIGLAWGLLVLARRGLLVRAVGSSLRMLSNPFLPKSLRIEPAPSTMTSIRLGGPVLAGAIIAVLQSRL